MPRPTVLVVEDEPTIRGMLAECLRSAGYPVEEAADGPAAIRALQADRPAHYGAVLLDLMLPRASGLEVLRHGRAALGASVPIVAISASRLGLDVARAAGATATVAKPFDVDELLALVERYCPG